MFHLFKDPEFSLRHQKTKSSKKENYFLGGGEKSVSVHAKRKQKIYYGVSALFGNNRLNQNKLQKMNTYHYVSIMLHNFSLFLCTGLEVRAGSFETNILKCFQISRLKKIEKREKIGSPQP
jgi:ABC-type siderophore export system fused ATPase/permease subunit